MRHKLKKRLGRATWQILQMPLHMCKTTSLQFLTQQHIYEQENKTKNNNNNKKQQRGFIPINGWLINILHVHKKGHPATTTWTEGVLYVQLWEELQAKLVTE